MNIMGLLQQFGRALMLPTIALPIAALFTALSYWVNAYFDLPLLADVLHTAGSSIFIHLPWIFAVGVALALTENSGSAGMSAVVGYLVYTHIMSLSETPIQFGVAGGILIGVLAAFCDHQFKGVRFPEYLQFFGGPRFVPMAMCIATLGVSILLLLIGSSLQHALETTSQAWIQTGSIGAFGYGFIHRLLVPLGLHHIFSNFAWFQAGVFELPNGQIVFGDLPRFFGQDASAGMFMTGFYWIKMFGLPAAALAIYHEAERLQRNKLSKRIWTAAAISLLVGVTEPIEFLFLIVAPGLFFIHAILNGVAMALAVELGIHHGFGFSAGLLEYVINYPLASDNAWLILPIGCGFAVFYYVLFRLWIRLGDVKTPGRERSLAFSEQSQDLQSIAEGVLQAIGSKDNLKLMEACITRLRLTVYDEEKVDQDRLMRLGASGVIRLGGGNVQVVFGTTAELISEEIHRVIKDGVRTDELMDMHSPNGHQTSTHPTDTSDKRNSAHSSSVQLMNSPVGEAEIVLRAPLSGKVVALSDVPDAVFASGLVGEGLAIEPSDTNVIEVCAPANATVLMLASQKHAIGLKLENGLEVMIHIGINSVHARGEGFTAFVQEGDQVYAGQKLIEVNAEYVKAHSTTLLTPIVLPPSSSLKKIKVKQWIWTDKGTIVQAGQDPILKGEFQ